MINLIIMIIMSLMDYRLNYNTSTYIYISHIDMFSVVFALIIYVL